MINMPLDLIEKLKECVSKFTHEEPITVSFAEKILLLEALNGLQTHEIAAQHPIAWVVGDEEVIKFINGDEVCVKRTLGDAHVQYFPLYAVPVLPKQPECEIPFGDVEPMEVTDNMVFAFHDSTSDEPLTDDGFRDIKQGLCAALMNTPRPAQPVTEPKPVGYFSYGSEHGFDWHETEKEAIESAEAAIDDYRGDACDGWSEETDSICWGVILQNATKVDERPRTDDDKCDPAIDTVCDYALLPTLEG